VARPAPETKKRTVPGMRFARGVRMKMIYTEAMCRADALREEAAGDPDCSAGAAVAPLRAAAQVVALEPERPDGHGVNWLAGKRPKPGDLLYGGDAVARALAAKNEAETNALKAAQEADELRAKLSATLDALADEVETSNTLRLQVEALGAAVSTAFVPLRAHGVLDADDNLDCWDTPPFELARRHVEALNAKDPAAMWRVAQLYVLGPNAELTGAEP
jgi:hypothetical protein